MYFKICFLPAFRQDAGVCAFSSTDVQVREIYPAAHIHAYGSLASNLQLPDSDVDLCIVFEGVQVSSSNLHGLVLSVKGAQHFVARCALAIG